MKPIALALAFSALGAVTAPVLASTYLNQSNITVEVGPGTSPGNFHNTFDNGATINKVIDAPSADAEEFHSQATHIWFTADAAGGGLELLFDFQVAYDISTLHFWNYNAEGYDVDDIQFSFFDGANAPVGTLSIQPDVGSPGGISAQDIVLLAPLNVRYVTAFLSGDNREVDFQNMGFTAVVSPPIPEPGSFALMGAGLLTLLWRRRRAAA